MIVGGQHAISTVGQPKISTSRACGALLSPLNISECNFLVADRKPRDFHPRLAKKKATERNHARSKGIRTRIDSQFHPLSERSQAGTNAHTTKMRRPTGRSELAGSWAGNRLAPRGCESSHNRTVWSRCLRLCPEWMLLSDVTKFLSCLHCQQFRESRI